MPTGSIDVDLLEDLIKQASEKKDKETQKKEKSFSK